MRAKANIILRVSGPSESLNIFVNGTWTGKKTPSQIKLSAGDFVSVYSRYTIYAWSVTGEEDYIEFKTETLEHGKRLHIDVGDGFFPIGFKFEKQITQSEFDRIVKRARCLRIVVASFCKNIFSISSLATQKPLWALELEETSISDISAISGLKDVRWLNLHGTPISDISPLANLKRLIELNLGRTKISNVSAIAKLKTLRALNLGESKISDLTPISNLKELQELYLAETNVYDISPLSKLRKLRWLELRDAKVSDVSPIANLKELRWLGLHGTQISDISALDVLKNLEVIRLGRTKVPQSQIRWLKEQLPNCNIIRTVDLY